MFYFRRLSVLEDKLAFCFKFVLDTIRDGLAFLKRNLIGFGVGRYQSVEVQDCTDGSVPIHMLLDHLTSFSNVY